MVMFTVFTGAKRQGKNKNRVKAPLEHWNKKKLKAFEKRERKIRGPKN